MSQKDFMFLCLEKSMNNICTWNRCINNALKQIDLAVTKYEPATTCQDYKKLEYCGTLANIVYCKFDKPSKSFDLYVDVDNRTVCIGTLNTDGKVTLSNTKSKEVCTNTYSWNRSMSKIVCDTADELTSFVAYEEPVNIDSVCYYYYNDNCICGRDVRNCPIYNPECLVCCCFTSGCTTCNDYKVTTYVTSQYVTEKFYNMFTNNIGAPLGWSTVDNVRDYLGYESGQILNSVYSTKCEPTITEYKSSRLCRQYCCLRCYKGPYGDVVYPYQESDNDLVLTEVAIGDYPTPNSNCDGYCTLNCIGNIDVFNINCWDSDGKRCLNRICCLTSLKCFQPTFSEKECDCCIYRWREDNCWKSNLSNYTLIDGNPNTYYFTDKPLQVVCIDGCYENGMLSYDCDLYNKYYGILKSCKVYSTECTGSICLYNKNCEAKSQLSTVLRNKKWGMCKAYIFYCVVQICEKITESDVSNCCVNLKEYYK